MTARIPLKIVGGTLSEFAPTDAVSADGIVPRSVTTLTLGDTATTGVSLTQGSQAANMLVGTADPSTPGVAAPEGSLYLRTTGGAGQLWTKTGAAATAWSPLYSAQVIAGQNANFNFTTFAPGTIICVASSAARTGTLPTPVKGLRWTVTDAGVPGTSGFATFNFTVARTGTERIAGVAADYVANTNLATLNLICDGTDWWLI